MSRINFVLSGVEHEKSFLTSGPGVFTRETEAVLQRIAVQEKPRIFDIAKKLK